MYSSVSTAQWHGKRDEYAKAIGGFAVYKMSTGKFDYFPTGQPPHCRGELDRGAKFVCRWFWNYQKWTRQQFGEYAEKEAYGR